MKLQKLFKKPLTVVQVQQADYTFLNKTICQLFYIREGGGAHKNF